MRELDVVGVRVEMPSNAPMVLLREVGGTRYLPIWIGANEASAIASAQEGVVPPRPLTHDLMVDTLRTLGHKLTEIHITELDSGTFYAVLLVDGIEVPIDGMALVDENDGYQPRLTHWWWSGGTAVLATAGSPSGTRSSVATTRPR